MAGEGTQAKEEKDKIVKSSVGVNRDTKMTGPRPVGGKGETDVLSNFYPCRVNVFGEIFKSGEAAYQWRKAKFMGKDRVAREILVASHARETKMIAKISSGRGGTTGTVGGDEGAGNEGSAGSKSKGV